MVMVVIHEIAINMKRQRMNQELILYIDATPNNNYPIRILEAYRKRCDCKWSSSSTEIVAITELMKLMNDQQDERAKILDRAIEILKRA